MIQKKLNNTQENKMEKEYMVITQCEAGRSIRCIGNYNQCLSNYEAITQKWKRIGKQTEIWIVEIINKDSIQ